MDTMERPKRTEVLRFRVTEDEREFVERVAREDDISAAAVIRKALKMLYEERAS